MPETTKDKPKTKVAFFGATGGTVLKCLMLAMGDDTIECHVLVREHEKLIKLLSDCGATNPSAPTVVVGDATEPNDVRRLLSVGINVIIFGVGGFQVGVKLGEENSWTEAPEQRRGYIRDRHVCEKSAKILCEVLQNQPDPYNICWPRLVVLGNIGCHEKRNILRGSAAMLNYKPYAWFRGHGDGSGSAYADKDAMEKTFIDHKILFSSTLLLRPAFLVDDPSDSVPPQVGPAINPALKLVASRETVGSWLYNEGIPTKSWGPGWIKTISKGH